MSRSALPSWVHGGVLALLLLVAYFTAWRPVRMEIMTSAVQPALQAAAAGSGAQVRVIAGGGAIRIQQPEGRFPSKGGFPAPAGVPFLLPALFLVVLAPRRPYWLLFWAGHVLLSGVLVLGWALALQGVDAGGYVATFTKAYGVDAYSLLVPMLVLVRHTLTSSEEEQPSVFGGGEGEPDAERSL